MKSNPVKNALLGVAVGDALGVPYEFKGRAELDRNPAKEMTGYGTYGQPEGTWSDDTSLTLCLADALLNGFDLKNMATKFIQWRLNMLWTARGEVFDIGNTTAVAIRRLRDIIEYGKQEELPQLKYQAEESDNGNGSLMRIMPLLFHIKGLDIKRQFEIVWEVSALTHRHIRAAMACLVYLKLAENVLQGIDKNEAYDLTRTQILDFWEIIDFSSEERKCFHRIILEDIRGIKRDSINSGGYVIESLEASIWCFLKHESYKDTVLAAVNLGHDTDTTAAIVGGLAGLHYGTDEIPEWWLASLARLEDIIELSEKLDIKYCS